MLLTTTPLAGLILDGAIVPQLEGQGVALRKGQHSTETSDLHSFANAGATVAQLEAIFGWQGGTMASLYTGARSPATGTSWELGEETTRPPTEAAYPSLTGNFSTRSNFKPRSVRATLAIFQTLK